MRKPSLKERLSYWFDNLMSRGTGALVALLFCTTVAVAVIVAFLAHLLAPGSAGSVGDSLWNSFMRILDAGNVTGDYESKNALYILLMIAATVCGLFVTSILIGIINAAFETRLETLRRGNSKVLEKGHTLILGYDEHLSTVLGELIIANENEKNPAVVVLCERDKMELEQELAQLIPSFKNTRLICRTGDPTATAALQNVALGECARVIALGNSDFEIIKEILAANTLLNDMGAPTDVTITAVITDEQNLDAARIAGGARVEALFFEKVISRIFAQTCRQAGLSLVYQELFDFEGDEIYMEKADMLAGLAFGELARYYRNASVMGLRRAGKVWLNPPPDTLLEQGDEVILIAADNGVAVPALEPAAIDAAQIHIRVAQPARAEKLLILGINRLTDDIIWEIDQYAAEGSTLTVASENAADGQTQLSRLNVQYKSCDVYKREALEALLAEKPDCIIVLSEEGEGDADARTLTILLQLSYYYRANPDSVIVVSEMLSKKNQELASVAHVNDFVIGTNLASLILTQVSQNRLLNPLFDELLTDAGSEIYIKPTNLFVPSGVPVSLYTLASATAGAKQPMLGLRLCRDDGSFDVLTNPDKEQTLVFRDADCVIVLAED
ncbi:MAG TPA: hypothetical protein PLP25_07020 [Candidatus Limiplasma sp.]|nr:hypothetical protein [Candidatus Limiplasma sp.]HPS81593.1 hypothetical protein [Candidatus Limiplasma sp.]